MITFLKIFVFIGNFFILMHNRLEVYFFTRITRKKKGNMLHTHTPEFYMMGGVYNPTKIRGYSCKNCHLKIEPISLEVVRDDKTSFFKRIFLKDYDVRNMNKFCVPCKEIVKRRSKYNVIKFSNHIFKRKIIYDSGEPDARYHCSECDSEIICDLYGMIYGTTRDDSLVVPLFSTIKELEENMKTCNQVKMESALE